MLLRAGRMVQESEKPEAVSDYFGGPARIRASAAAVSYLGASTRRSGFLHHLQFNIRSVLISSIRLYVKVQATQKYRAMCQFLKIKMGSEKRGKKHD